MASKSKKLFLGVDAGATKTDVAIADAKGKIVGRGSAGPGSFNVLVPEDICDNISAALIKALRKARLGSKVSFTGVVFGMAGIDAPGDHDEMKPLLKEYFKAYLPKKFSLVNDVVIGLHAGTTKGYGVAVIAGTGSNFYGRNKAGKEHFASGLGHVLSDEGSAYMIGLQALRAAVRSFDGRGVPTLLEQGVQAYFRLETMRDLSRVVYHGDFAKSDAAALAPLVDVAASEGDEVAMQILAAAAHELALGAAATINTLGMAKTSFQIVLIGGVFDKNAYILREFKKVMKKVAPKASCLRPRKKPVSGALALARLK